VAQPGRAGKVQEAGVVVSRSMKASRQGRNVKKRLVGSVQMACSRYDIPDRSVAWAWKQVKVRSLVLLAGMQQRHAPLPCNV